MVCEDMWTPDVTECLEESGAEILVVLNGSPYEIDKPDERLNLAVARITESGLPMVYVNQVGGQDELVFDGGRRLRASPPGPGLARGGHRQPLATGRRGLDLRRR
jgi:NAD+ synthase